MRLGLDREIINYEYIAATLARCSDEEQVRFFQAFIKECLSWGTSMQVESQLAAINIKLTDEEKDVIGMLGFKE